MSDAPVQGRRQRALIATARFVRARALWIVLAALVLATASVVYTALRIEFVTDRNALVDPEAEYNQRFLSFMKAFGDQELMLLMVGEAPGPVGNPGYNPHIPGDFTRTRMKEAAARVVERLQKRPDLFPQIVQRVPPDEFGGTRMLYLPEADLDAIATQVEDSRPVVESIARDPSFKGLLQGMRDGIEQGAGSGDDQQLKQGGEQLRRLLAEIRESLASAQESPAPGQLFAFRSSDPAIDPEGYLFLWDGRLLFVAILPKRNPGALNQVEEPLAYARAAVAEVQQDYPELAIGLTGRPVIYSDEMAASSRDMTWATIFAVVAVGLMFIFAFRSFVRPMLAVLCLVLALAWTFGATTLLIGHLNIFAMVFAVVLVGLGIDFGIHLLSHYRQGIAHGLSVREALTETYAEIGMGTVLGAVTTAAALSTAALTDFLGLAELGLICGMGIVCCLVAMLVVFPAMLVLLDSRRVGQGNPALRATMRDQDAQPAPRPAASRGARLAALLVVLLVAGGVAVSAVGIADGYVPFDYNLLDLNDPDAEGVHWEKLLIDHDQRASYAVSIRNSPEELRELSLEYDRLRGQGIVRATESMLPPNESARRAQLARIHAALPGEFADPATPGDAAGLRTAARGLQSALRQLATRGLSFEAAFADATIEAGALVELARQRPEHVDARLREVEPQFFGALVRQLRELQRDANPPPVTAETLPSVLASRYVGSGPDGETLYALYVYPAKNAWIRENAGEFNAAVLAIDPQATGVTVQIHESGSLIVDGFGKSVVYALIAILLLLLLDLRRPLAMLLALFPLFTSLSVLLGVMTLTDLSFNFANFFGVPILIGTTVDAGVYLVHAQRHGDPRRTLAQTRGACLLCGLTTLFGFGALVSASHTGIVSLGLVLVIGSVASILASYFAVPVALAWFNESGTRI
ncbi:MAG: MMPL family transporter [Planctomycetes bacterium]|nr:MMPL family transporter [Planctomycetota bacterium]